MATKDEDWVEHLFLARTHDYLMFFTRQGQCYWLKVYDIPPGGRASRGKPIVNLLNLRAEEKIAALVPVREFSHDRWLMFATRKGMVKKTVLSAYGNPRVVGINAMNILEGDELIGVELTSGGCNVVLATRQGMAIRFQESDVREMGRATSGVRGITLEGEDEVIGMVALHNGNTLLVVSEHGMGKRTGIEEYRLQRRGGKGVINLRTNAKTGTVVSIKEVLPDDELMLVTRAGIVNRQSVDGIRVIGRNTQGVRLVNLTDGDTVVDVARLASVEPTPDGAGAGEPAGEPLPPEDGADLEVVEE